MSYDAQDSVALLKWSGEPDRVIQDTQWTFDQRDDSTNQLRAVTSLSEADGVEDEQELIFQGRRFIISGVDRARHDGQAEIIADEAQAELGGHILTDFEFTSWTLQQMMEWALRGTRWTPGEVQPVRFGRAHFEDITVLEALHFLARHQDSVLTFDSLRRRVNITATRGQVREEVFTYGRQLTDITKESRQPETTTIHCVGADDMTIASVNNGVPYVEDYSYYTSKGVSLADARRWFKKEDYWEDSRYTVPENMKRDALDRLAVEAYPAITYTLVAQATTSVDGTDDFDLTEIVLGDRVYVWDQEIDTRLIAEVTAVKTSSDASDNELTLSYLPESLSSSGGRGGGQYQGDSGSTAGNPLFPRSGFQPRPSMPILEHVSSVGVAEVRWNGQDHDAEYDTIPVRFGSVIPKAVRLTEDGSIPSPDSDDAFDGTPIHQRGGGVSTLPFPGAGEYSIWFYMLGNDQRTVSEYSEPLIIEVPDFVDTEWIEEQLNQAKTELEQAMDERANQEGTGAPSGDAHDGVVYYQRDSPGGPVVAVWQYRDGDWHGLPMTDAVLTAVTTDKLIAGESLIDGVLIRDGAITLRNIEVTEELMAALLTVKKIEAGDIEANAIDGMTITGGVISGGRVEGSQVVGGQLQIGSRYTGSGNSGSEIDSQGVYRHYNTAGEQDVLINGASNAFYGSFASHAGSGARVSISGTGNIYDSPTILLDSGKGEEFPAQVISHHEDSGSTLEPGSIQMSTRQMSGGDSSTHVRLQPRGDFSLQQLNGTQAGLGIVKDGSEVDVRGVLGYNVRSQILSGEVTGINMSGYAAYAASVTYNTPTFSGTRRTFLQGSYRHSSASHRAMTGVRADGSSGSTIVIGDTTGGATWRLYWQALWVR